MNEISITNQSSSILNQTNDFIINSDQPSVVLNPNIQDMNFSQFLQANLSITYEFIQYHFVTLLIVVLIITAIIVNHKGTKKNINIAFRVKNIIEKFLKQNFNNYSGELIEQSPNIIKLYASGRQSCIFSIFAFALVPRQQMLSYFFNIILFGLKDQLVIQIPLKTVSSYPLTMAIVRKKNIRQITKKKYPDIKNLCKQYRPTKAQAFNVPSTHSILVQKKQHVNYLLMTEKQVDIWQSYGKLVKMVYFSDVNKFSRYPNALRMVINLTEEQIDKNQGKGIISLLNWMLAFTDRMSKLKMNINEKKELKKKRQSFNIGYDQD